MVHFTHLIVALKGYHELIAAGMSRNWAIRSLNEVINAYADQFHTGKEILVSKAARGRPRRDMIREHGTPRSALNTEYIEAYRAGRLTEEKAQAIAVALWRQAFITREEDQRLRDLGLRFKAKGSPEERWAAAGIEF